MNLTNWIYFAFFAVVVAGGFSGGVTADQLAAISVLGLTYAAGGTHGLYLGWTHQKRMDQWAARVVERRQEVEQEQEKAA